MGEVEEIKVGEYVRTRSGNIGKVLDITNVTMQKRKKYLIKWDISKAYYITAIRIVKHSPNIIDLIENDDFITLGKNCYPLRVDAIWELGGELNIELDNGAQFEDIKNDKDFQIYSIVTHEQFNQVKYEV